MKLKGHRFVDSDEVIENATKQLKDLSKNGFLECSEQLYERWKKCMDAGGNPYLVSDLPQLYSEHIQDQRSYYAECRIIKGSSIFRNSPECQSDRTP
ncbi:hypothetical protein AVEN_132526-1 [Araneus ventricosus]|uniref:Uncharacterized protein n=1 Tax=Araneus ventricosus TaxID=182803 RepID=A0A4Y2PZJ9_ARAVE|nr:hypothetical protein AVEN_132526-1 [Araneus ventricosus]